MESDPNKTYIGLLKGVQLPPKFIQPAKVLPGGMQSSLLIGVPRWMYKELYMNAHMDKAYNTSSAILQAFDRFVVQPICKLFPGTSDCIEETHQIFDLDEECVEGPDPYHFGNDRRKGTDRIHKTKQYQSTMTFQLTAVKKKVVKVEKPNHLVFGYINGSDCSDSEEMKDDE
ncbi:hypothetical protein HJC23_004297 [Cyclotella cryptica]|uniref:DNA-directed DNA polymerase n=1 Tax=Cyclotella cryptica TaxID=29204 RepID=A0ABD3Q3Z3_9STRA